ncbi:hypothetical protein EZS27_004777 [termite gut metagenome]|uniref:Uncharacterized protein n=1 Tax=termite gut metagenome TaxID=433724 RepID=A0A5J4SQV9_9ZZZZ
MRHFSILLDGKVKSVETKEKLPLNGWQSYLIFCFYAANSIFLTLLGCIKHNGTKSFPLCITYLVSVFIQLSVCHGRKPQTVKIEIINQQI